MSVSLGFHVGPQAGPSNSFSPDFKDGLKDILLGVIGAGTTIGLQALQNKFANPSQNPQVIYAQQSGQGQYQVPGVNAPQPVDYNSLIKIGLLGLAVVVAIGFIKR
jgi:hypothetical protein